MKLTLWSIITFTICTMSAISLGSADQYDARLNLLFADLQSPLSSASVKKIEQQIWSHWGAFPEDQEIEATMILGIQVLEAGQLRRSETIFSQIIEQEPNFAEAWNKRATVRFLIGNHLGSAKDIAKVLQLEPRHFGALSGLGMIHMSARNLESALEAYEAAFVIHPNLANVQNIIEELKTRIRGQAL